MKNVFFGNSTCVANVEVCGWAAYDSMGSAVLLTGCLRARVYPFQVKSGNVTLTEELRSSTKKLHVNKVKYECGAVQRRVNLMDLEEC